MNTRSILPAVALAASSSIIAGANANPVPLMPIIPSFSNYYDVFNLFQSLRPKLHQINWPNNQRKNRKNARRRWAAGDKKAFR